MSDKKKVLKKEQVEKARKVVREQLKKGAKPSDAIKIGRQSIKK